jgi:hypothetical protein
MHTKFDLPETRSSLLAISCELGLELGCDDDLTFLIALFVPSSDASKSTGPQHHTIVSFD